MVLLREKQFWQVYAHLAHMIFLLDYSLGESLAQKATQEQLRNESVRIVEELLQSIQKSNPQMLIRYVS
jgi:hypothetical protein